MKKNVRMVFLVATSFLTVIILFIIVFCPWIFLKNDGISLGECQSVYISMYERRVANENFKSENMEAKKIKVNEIYQFKQTTYFDYLINNNVRCIVRNTDGSFSKVMYDQTKKNSYLLNLENKLVEEKTFQFQQCGIENCKETAKTIFPFKNLIDDNLNIHREKTLDSTISINGKEIPLLVFDSCDYGSGKNLIFTVYPAQTQIDLIAIDCNIRISQLIEIIGEDLISNDGTLLSEIYLNKYLEIPFTYQREIVLSEEHNKPYILEDTGTAQCVWKSPYIIADVDNSFQYYVKDMPDIMNLCNDALVDIINNSFLLRR